VTVGGFKGIRAPGRRILPRGELADKGKVTADGVTVRFWDYATVVERSRG
jgi:hypothetical protein